jgi:phage shock protein PspC (stress-responsive transcriptional regulator)
MKRLYRSRTNKVFAGICGGIGEYLNVDPVLIRVIAVMITIFGGSGIIAYIVGLVLIPLGPESEVRKEKTEAEKPESQTEEQPIPAPVGLPTEKHISILGGLYITLSSITLIAAIIVFLAIAGGGIISGDELAIAITTTVASVIASLLVLISAPGIICGIGLLKQRPWSRVFALILGVINLINIPFGTALGIYTFWVLMKPESEEIFKNN